MPIGRVVRSIRPSPIPPARWTGDEHPSGRRPAGHLLSSSRYRHPGDVIRLISAAFLLACSLAVSWVAFRRLLGPAASVPGGARPGRRRHHRPGGGGLPGRGGRSGRGHAAQAPVPAATGLAAGAVAAAGLAAAIFALFGGPRPAALTADLARGSWVASARVPRPGAVRVGGRRGRVRRAVASLPWRRAAWLTLLLAAAARIVVGTALPMELILALAAGVTVGAAVLVTFGVPDRRIGTRRDRGGAAARGSCRCTSVRLAEAETRGSRKFAAVAADGRRLLIKALGSDQRDADLLYRAYRAVRLRNVGDTRPAASLFEAVERQALVGVMAERAGVLRAQRRPRCQGPRRYRAAGHGMGGRQHAGAASRRTDQRRPARAAVGGGGQAAPGGESPIVRCGPRT